MAATDPEVRRAIASLGGYTRAEGMTRAEHGDHMVRVRQAKLDRWADEIDPDRQLDPAELEARLRRRLRIEMTKMALASAKKRAAARAERERAMLDAVIAGDS